MTFKNIEKNDDVMDDDVKRRTMASLERYSWTFFTRDEIQKKRFMDVLLNG